MDEVAQLPDDPALLKRMIAQKDAVIAERDRCIEAMERRHKAEMDAILRRFYGPRSETFDPTELLLFGEAMAEAAPVDPAVVEAESGEKLVTRRIVTRHKHCRQKLPGHLPRFEVIHDLPDAQKRCPCCDAPRACIGSEENEQLEFVRPLVELIKSRVKQSKVIHTDDTTVKVQDAGRKGTCRTGRVWCYLGDESNPYDVFDFSPDRKREHPQKFLGDFAGYLQADAYGGYDGIYTKGKVIEVACWAHARRKFFDAKETDGRRAATMLRFVGRLYHIERAIKARIETRRKSEPAFTLAEQHAFTRSMRQKRSTRTLAKIRSWLDAEQHLVLPRSPMAAAITYTLNQWAALNRYVEQGFLNIDNNAAERALKRVAIGRKNWLFAGHDAAGASHARLWTLIASAERHGVDPQRYLTSVLAKVGQTKLSELGQFLPDVWKAEDAMEPSP